MPLILVRTSDDAVLGAMRVLPFPVPSLPETFYNVHTDPLPGQGRSPEAMAAYLIAHQQTGPDSTLSGVKLGRIALRADVRRRGLGRAFLAEAERWLCATLAPACTPTHDRVRIQLTAQSVSRGFYESVGYQATSGEFCLLNQPHIWYAKTLCVFCVMPRTEYRTEIACSDERLRAAYLLRQTVFTDEQGYDGDRDLDHWDDTAVHVVLVRASDDAVVGVLRIVPYPLPAHDEQFYSRQVLKDGPLPGRHRTESEVQATFLRAQVAQPSTHLVYSGAKVGRIAIHASLRGCGMGRRLVEGAEAWITQAIRTLPVPPRTESVWVQVQLSSQAPVRAFYESQGYAVQGDVYLEEGQPHIWCRKVLPVST